MAQNAVCRSMARTSMMRALASWKSSVSRADVRVVYLKKSSQAALREMAVSLHLQGTTHYEIWKYCQSTSRVQA